MDNKHPVALLNFHAKVAYDHQLNSFCSNGYVLQTRLRCVGRDQDAS